MKKSVVLLAAAVMAGSIALNAQQATETAKGSCGKTSADQVNWVLTSDSTLTISGTGEMEDHPTWGSQKAAIKRLVIQEGVTSIGESAFFWCTNLKEAELAASIEKVGTGAFYGTGWYDNQPQGEVYIGSALWVYKGEMPAESKIEVKEGTKRISERAFSDCKNLTELVLPKSLIEIGKQAFIDCSGITSMTVNATVPPAIDESTFYGVNRNIEFTVPEESAEAYKADANWKTFMMPTAVEETEANGIKIYRDGEQIAIDGAEGDVEIYSVTGSLVYRGSDTRITLTRGTYIIKGSSWSEKISM